MALQVASKSLEAADIIKRAMIDVNQWLLDKDIRARIIMQVHDELVVEVKAGELESVGDKVCEPMTASASLQVPLEKDIGVGNSWEEAH